MYRPLVALLASVFALPAFAADPPSIPFSVQLVTVTPVKDGGIQMTEIVGEPVVIDRLVEKVVDGKKVQVTEKATVMKQVLKAMTLDAKSYKATTADGKAIPAAELEKKLKGGAVVALSWGSMPADLRKVFKDDTVFIERLLESPGK